MRASDRWEATARIVAVVLLLAAVPLAVHAGATRYEHSLVQERADAAAAKTVTTVVTEHPTMVVQDSAAAAKTWQTRVSWTRGGRAHTAVVDVPPTVVPGDRLPVRLGGDGRPLRDLSPADLAMGDGVDRAMKVFGCTALGIGVLLAAVSASCALRRRTDWSREWHALSRTVNRGWDVRPGD